MGNKSILMMKHFKTQIMVVSKRFPVIIYICQTVNALGPLFVLELNVPVLLFLIYSTCSSLCIYRLKKLAVHYILQYMTVRQQRDNSSGQTGGESLTRLP